MPEYRMLNIRSGKPRTGQFQRVRMPPSNSTASDTLTRLIPIGIHIPSEKVIGDTAMICSVGWRVQVPSEKALASLGLCFTASLMLHSFVLLRPPSGLPKVTQTRSERKDEA